MHKKDIFFSLSNQSVTTFYLSLTHLLVLYNTIPLYHLYEKKMSTKQEEDEEEKGNGYSWLIHSFCIVSLLPPPPRTYKQEK
jgi:hypothetical protein